MSSCSEIAKRKHFQADRGAWRRQYKSLHERKQRGTLTPELFEDWKAENNPDNWTPFEKWSADPGGGRLRVREDFSAWVTHEQNDFVFASSAGTSLERRNVSRRGLEPAISAAGLDDDARPRLSMHSLRQLQVEL
jgi:hypothetical protein